MSSEEKTSVLASPKHKKGRVSPLPEDESDTTEKTNTSTIENTKSINEPYSDVSVRNVPPIPQEQLLADIDFDEIPEGRAVRRARGKSVYLSCFVGIDCIYFIARLVIFLRVDIFHDAWFDSRTRIEISQQKVYNNSTNEQLVSAAGTSLNYYFCENESLEAQCAWIFSVTWLCYFLANVSLIFSILWLSLKLCYAYIFMKTTSVLLHFLGLLTFGYHCLSQKFYIETGVFFIFHLPLQIYGTKRSKTYATSLKKAELEKSLTREIYANRNPEAASMRRRRRSTMLPRRSSYARFVTVDD